MSRIPVSAPGKAFLIGEYAVLEGAPALVTAVTVRAVAHDPADGAKVAPTSAVIGCAHARVSAYLRARGASEVGPAPIVETGGFSLGERKIGAGSSAAVAAAVVGFHLAEHGLDPRSEPVQLDALHLARAAHAEAQGGHGTGADVAACVLGGTIRFTEARTEKAPIPSWLAVGFADAGQPATTKSLVQTVRSAAAQDRSAYEEAMSLLRRAVETFDEAYRLPATENGQAPDGAFEAICEATQLHNRGLRTLAELSGAPIFTETIETIIGAAEDAGIGVKPSGAGGGDLVALFARSQGDLDRLGERLHREHEIPLLSALRCDAEGLRPDDRVPTNSRLRGLFKLSVDARREAIAETTGIPLERFKDLDSGSLGISRANHMIENVVGTFEFPIAIATNFRINGHDYLVPMCVEEASVVAAASNAAKMIREGGGFVVHSDPPWMISQIQLCGENAAEDGSDASRVVDALSGIKQELLERADQTDPQLVSLGGGARDIEVRVVAPDMVVVHVLVDCRDAMGANLVNTVAEALAPRLQEVTGWTVGLRILSNLADRRCCHVAARVPPQALAREGWPGERVVAKIVSASRFAELDPYRAATHNKGIMNGVDAVVLATGNDWRAMEASAHAYAARNGAYAPLAIWRCGEDGWLEGKMSIPMAVGVVGGATRVHPVARLALEIVGCATAAELGQVMAAAGLASNLAAVRALATEGIQRGHMSLHARSIAVGAGAKGAEIDRLTRKLIDSGDIRAARAETLLRDIRSQNR